jgi:catechol 2,3-dioxygenase-like lactoylglutathione lyase family enzyme
MVDIELQHYGVYCDNLDVSVDFYTNVLGFKVLFKADADENGTPLKMAWIKHPGGIVIELLALEGYKASVAALNDRNHLALRTPDMDAAVTALKAAGVQMEVDPFDTGLAFDRELGADKDTYTTCNASGVMLKVGFFRGPSGERFELMQDNLGGM